MAINTGVGYNDSQVVNGTAGGAGVDTTIGTINVAAGQDWILSSVWAAGWSGLIKFNLSTYPQAHFTYVPNSPTAGNLSQTGTSANKTGLNVPIRGPATIDIIVQDDAGGSACEVELGYRSSGGPTN
jgi:hypothetical protein